MAEATYFVGTTSSASAPNKVHLCLMNSAGSGRLMKIYQVRVSAAPSAAVVGLMIPLGVYRTSTQPTGGTVVKLYAAATGEVVVAAATAVCQIFPTNALTIEQSPFGVGVVMAEETLATTGQDLYNFAISGMRPIECAPGTGVAIRQGVIAAASGALSCTVFFTLV
mgnify:CR=1 FL=1